jgi:hypothetical protein
MSKKGRSSYTPNDQRAIVKNSTSREFRLDQANQAKQAAQAQAPAQPAAPANSDSSKR